MSSVRWRQRFAAQGRPWYHAPVTNQSFRCRQVPRRLLFFSRRNRQVECAMPRPTQSASSSREQFMQIVQDELAKFERAERALRKQVKNDRVEELKLPEELAH